MSIRDHEYFQVVDLFFMKAGDRYGARESRAVALDTTVYSVLYSTYSASGAYVQ